MRSKDKVCSRCSTEKLVCAPFLIHYALNNDERATHSRFPLTNVMWRVRGRLTLMLAVAANAAPTPAPARHLWFTNVTLGVPFATPRTRRASQVIECFSCHPTVAGWRMVLGAGSGGKTSSLTLLVQQRFVRHPAGSHRASLPQAQHRLSRCLLIRWLAATSLRQRQS
jgi:hypothetical protein